MRTTTMAATVAMAAVLVTGAAFVGPAAEAAPGSSPFAGEYTGQAGGQYAITWGRISISAGGRIAGSSPQGWDSGKFSGTVADDGSYSLSGSAKFRWGPPGQVDNWVSDVRPGRTPRDAQSPEDSAIGTTYSFTQSGTMTLGADGDLLVTNSAGATFVWTRK